MKLRSVQPLIQLSMTQTLQYFEYNIMLDATTLAASSVTFLSQGFIIKKKKEVMQDPKIGAILGDDRPEMVSLASSVRTESCSLLFCMGRAPIVISVDSPDSEVQLSLDSGVVGSEEEIDLVSQRTDSLLLRALDSSLFK